MWYYWSESGLGLEGIDKFLLHFHISNINTDGEMAGRLGSEWLVTISKDLWWSELLAGQAVSGAVWTI